MGTRRLLGVALVSGLPACSAEPYGCDEDRQCTRAGLQGVCVVPGHCAYEDPSCESGLRYSSNAIAGLDGECYTGAIAGGSSAGSGDAGSESSGGGEPFCGNGRLDDPEECDDGNDQAGDGCTPECRRSGGIRWVARHAGPDGRDDRARAIQVYGEDTVLVAGEQGEPEDVRSALALAYALDGTASSEPWIDDEPADRRVHGLATTVGRLMIVGDQPSMGAAGGRAWFAQLDSSLQPELLGAVDTLAEETGRGAVLTPRGFALVGSQDGQAWARWVDEDVPDWLGDAVDSVDVVAARGDGAFVVAGPTSGGSVHWWLVSGQGVDLAQGDASGDEIHAAGFDDAGRPWLGGARGGGPWVAAYGLDGGEALSITVPLGGAVEGLAGAPGGDMVMAGTDGSGGWAGRVDAAGEVRWTSPVEAEGDLQLHAVAYDQDVLYVAGAERNGAGDLDVFVAALEP